MKTINPAQTMRNKFGMERRLRRQGVSHFGGMEAGKLHPVAFQRFRPDEGGTVQTKLSVKLAPVSGFMRTNAYVDVIQVFVPYQAMEKLELDTTLDAGVTEMTRRRLMAGSGIGLENQNEISKAGYVHPRSVGGDKKVSRTVRLAYIAAVNHLRRAAYFNATQLDKTVTSIQPAVLTANILERFNGVLEPENLIDGAIALTGELPVTGYVRTGDGQGSLTAVGPDGTNLGSQAVSQVAIIDGQPDQLYSSLDGVGNITLRDMMESKKLDEMIRSLAQMVKDDPLHGEEKVARALYGLSVDYDDDCQVMYRKVHEIVPMHTRPIDGPSINDVSANFEVDLTLGTVVPRGELGGQLVTLVSVKPLETLEQQPDPTQTESWALVNRVQDELQLDEVLLTRADLESGVAAIDEDTEAFWTGHNSIKHDYMSQGPNVQQTLAVEMQSSMWTYPVPTSVTADNVNYPASLNMYPFYNWNGAHAEYTVRQVANVSTTLAKGPNPVERIQLFADDPTLITG